MKLPDDFYDTLRQSLIATGANPYRAVPVARFVSQCYELLLSAHQILAQPARWNQFCGVRGATTTRRKSTAKPANIAETAITAHLSMEAQHLLERRGRLAPVFQGPTVGIACVIADYTAPSDVATGSSSKRPDLVFFPTEPALQLQFAMEAKIIRQATSVADELLGEEGFGCFIRAVDPYETNGVVGLLGYVEPAMHQGMIDEAGRCMHEDQRFANVGVHDLIIEGSTHVPRTALGHIVNARPKVCLANMLALNLTAACSPTP
ncbi:hypothetical protein [Ralstonia sp. UBA689]|uniref:hypothetical protein n=1 Tax=Ralstonia sp. UBA689 TaxID=1947373 RepID=UPI0025CD2F37|nr:hypothetical protein [Ralstonia sp. UBA689]